ncbi:hypothetical protein KEM56_003377 [Ascosphaera pollenicola]|nr:hypothetical protein KEM56_003377 [Ascosphaera pollenicola]
MSPALKSGVISAPDSHLSDTPGFENTPESEIEIPTSSPKKRSASGQASGSPKKAKMSEATVKEPAATPSMDIPMNAITEADRLMLTMKESGAGWPYIHNAWEKKSGRKIGRSTLRKRYAALQSDTTPFSEEDANRLVKFKQEVEAKFETEKWSRIADLIVSDGGGHYTGSMLRKKHKEMLRP